MSDTKLQVKKYSRNYELKLYLKFLFKERTRLINELKFYGDIEDDSVRITLLQIINRNIEYNFRDFKRFRSQLIIC